MIIDRQIELVVIYMHVPIMALAALNSTVFQIYVNFDKNLISIDCQNNEQRDRASNCLYMHVQIISLAALDSSVFQIYMNTGKN